MIRFALLFVLCLLAVPVQQAMAQCEGGSCRVGVPRLLPRNRASVTRIVLRGDCCLRGPIRGRLFDGDGRPFRRAE